MWPLVLLWGCLVLPGYDALKGPKEISGHEGETVSVKCTYGEELRKHMKYWCRQGGILFSRCTGTIYTKGDQEVTQGSFRPAIQLDSTITEDTSPVPSSGSSKPSPQAPSVSPRVSIPLVRMLTPVLVLLSLLLATCLIALGSHMLRRKKKGEPAQLAMGTQRNEKVHLPASTLGNGCAPEDVVINLAGPAGPRECAAGPYTNIQCLNQKMKWGDGAQYTKVRHVGRETKKKEKKSPTISWLPGDNHDCRSHSATFPNFVLHKLCDVLLTE
ncbi:CMRF35-like molecule 9 isoform X24 [Castor canadensis]|uniref:CMRF35-like molecule 9 isoform X24 n=1 Tax=Castor canadensis TaxID=51338 RepID=A0AC58K9M0_CASCN